MVLVPLNQRHTEAELGYALEDSGAKVLFAGAGINYPPGVVPHVFDLDDGYESLIANAGGGLPRRAGPGHGRRAVLHGGHDGGREGRDADAPQPGRQRASFPGLDRVP